MSSVAETVPPGVQKPILVLAGVVAVVLFANILEFGLAKGLLFLIGIGLGVALYHAAFGFTGAYRRALTTGDVSGITAQAVMLGAAYTHMANAEGLEVVRPLIFLGLLAIVGWARRPRRADAHT